MLARSLRQTFFLALFCAACSDTDTSGTAPDTALPDAPSLDSGVADEGADLVTSDGPLPDAGGTDGPGAPADLLGCTVPDPGNAATCTAKPSGQIAWWRAEGTFNDSIGGLHGTNVGATFVAGKVGQAFAFNGSGQYVSLGNISGLDFTGQDFTVEAWLRISDLPTLNPGGSGCVPMYPLVANRDWGWSLNIIASGGVAFNKYTTQAGGLGIASCTAPIPLDTWVHLAAVHTTTELRLYLNGVLQAAKASPISTIYYEPTDEPEFGARRCASGIYYLKGALDEISIYDRALTAQEITSVASAGDKGKCP